MLYLLHLNIRLILILFNIFKANLLHDIFNLFKGQLQIPHDKIDETYAKSQAWISINSDAIKEAETKFKLNFNANYFEQQYKYSKTKLDQIMPFEKRLIESGKSLEVYNEYLDYELKLKDPNRIRCLFEREITDHCLVLDVWTKYINYEKSFIKLDQSKANNNKMESSLDQFMSDSNIYDKVEQILKRAERNIGMCVEIWLEYICLNELFNKSEEETQEIFERSLKHLTNESLGKIWLRYLQYKRRKTDFNDSKQVEKLRDNFELAVVHLSGNPNADPLFKVSIFQAKVEAKYCSNIEKSREIWEAIMKFHKNLGDQQVNFWLQYADLEKLFGDRKNYKKVMLRALEYCVEYYQLLSEQLMSHFEEECNNIIEIEEVKKRIQNIYNQFVKPRLTKLQAEQETIKEDKGIKRKIVDSKNSDKSSSKKAKFEPQSRPPPSNVALKPKEVNELETVVVKNLAYDVQENEIRDLFSKFGTIKDIRLVKDYNGRSKGFCYVEFSSIEGAKKAAQNDRKFELHGREVYINEYNKKTDFKYGKGLEKNKLFVSKIPMSANQEKLNQIFSKFEGFKEVRLNKLRNGHFKGNAYVDFKTDKDAANALKETNGLEIYGKKIEVAISNPPKKREDDRPTISRNTTRALGDAAVFKRPAG